MKILSKIKRPGGSKIPMPNGKGVPDTEYFFEPNERGDHVAEVTNKAHVQRFLSIIEGFEPYDEEAVAEAQAVEAEANALSELESRINVGSVESYVKLTLEELRELYHARFGRLAPAVMKHETMVRKLVAHDLERAIAAAQPAAPAAPAAPAQSGEQQPAA